MSRTKKLLNKTSEKKLNSFISKLDDFDGKDKFSKEFIELVTKDVRMLKDCSEKSVVDFYIATCDKMFNDENLIINDEFYNKLKSSTRHKLANKYTSSKTFDNNIDIYFNEVKKEYILHPQGESEEMEFIPENKDIFIKNNLKLVVECARRYQNLGLPLEDLIQIGNIGLLTAFEKFDTNRANLRFDILKDIKNSELESFTNAQASEIVKRNFSYTKLLDSTLAKIPEEGFKDKDDFNEWTNNNIKKASFASIGFAWIRAQIIIELNKLSKIVRVPKSANKNEENNISIIRLDSINPQTQDNYYDNQIYDTANDEFIIEDESIEIMERQNIFKDLVEKLLYKLNATDRRIIKKRFGIGYPYQAGINEIAESEGLPVNKVKYSVLNSLKIISNNIPEHDKKTIEELLR